MSISLDEALTKYSDYLRKLIDGLDPGKRNNQSYVTVRPKTGQLVKVSYPQLLGEVQRKTDMGENETIKWANQSGYQVSS